MRWGLDILLSLVGAVIGFAAVYGLTTDYGWEISLLAAVVLALVLGQFAGGKFFMNGFVTGVIASLLQSLIMWGMYDTFMANFQQTAKYQEVVEQLEKVGRTFDPQQMKTWTLIGAPIGAAFSGAVLGLLAMGAGKIFGKKPEPIPAATAPVEPPTDDVNNPPA